MQNAGGAAAYGRSVTITYRGLRDLNVIYDELEHGAELIFTRHIETDVGERRAEEITELFHKSAGGARIGFRESADRVEGIKKEVRMQLGAQDLEPRFRQTPFEIGGPYGKFMSLALAVAGLSCVIA